MIPYVLILLVDFFLSATARQDGLSLLLYKSVALVILSQAYSESFGYTLETKRPELLSRQVRALYILYRDPSDHRLSSRYLSIINFPLLLDTLKGLEKLALRGHWCRQFYNMHPDPSSSITDLILIEPHATLKACTCINFRCVPCTSLIPITSSPQHLGHSGICRHLPPGHPYSVKGSIQFRGFAWTSPIRLVTHQVNSSMCQDPLSGVWKGHIRSKNRTLLMIWWLAQCITMSNTVV